jgi:hypothetical protein
VRKSSSWKIAALIATLAVLAGLVAKVSTGRAATPPPTLKLFVSPKPVVAAGQNVIGILRFSYPANASPTTITSVFETVTISPALSSASDYKSALSSSACTLQTLSTVRCDLGNVRAGNTRTTYIVVSAPSSGSQISMSGVAQWNENVNGGNPQSNNMVPSVPGTDSTTVVSGATAVNSDGKCTVGGSSLDTTASFTGSNQQATHVDYPANAQGLPCTPAAIQDDQTPTNDGVCNDGTRSCVFSQIVLPLLATNTFATDVITFNGSLFDSPPNTNKFRVLELLDPPDSTTEVVPLCSSGNRSTGGACEVGAVKFGMKGIQVTLQVPGTTIDPRYGG